MSNYQTQYPSRVELYDGRKLQLNFNDNQNRVLVPETNTPLNTLQEIFEMEGFTRTTVEYKKPFQISQGLTKRLTRDWDMHIRFLQLHQEMIAIDAEIETSREYIQHINGKWISVIYEVTSLLDKHGISWGIWHKSAMTYVKNVIERGSIILDQISGKIEWKPIVVGTIIGITAGLILKGIFDSDDD